MTEDQETNLIDAVQKNAESIEYLTEETKETRKILKYHAEETRGLVETWEAMAGAIKVFNMIGKFFAWLSSFAVVGYIISWWIEHLKT